MKFNFRKIMSVLAGTVMLSSTVALAAAANYPSPFVKGGNADVAIVYGSMPGAEVDLLAVTDINSNLASALARQTATSGTSTTGSSTVSGGDFVKLERSTDHFNIGENTNKFFSSLDDEELSTVLADGVYQNDDNEEFDFTQTIAMGQLPLTHFQDSELDADEKPLIGFDLADGTHVLNYTLDFTPDAAEGGTAFADLETTELTLLGRTYYVVDAATTSSGVKLTLLDAANSAIVEQGTTSSVAVGDKSYEVSISFIDSDEVILIVDGKATNKLQEGDVFKIADDTYIAVKNVLYSAKEGETSKAEISIGSGKIVLENNQEIEVNNEDVSDIEEYNDAEVKSYITNTTTNINKIVLEWVIGDDEWIVPGREITLPAFETIKVSMGAFNVPTQEKTTVKNDGSDSIKLTTFVEDGEVDFNLLYANATGFIGLGKDSDERLVVTNASTLRFDTDVDSWFVASWVSGDDAESYVLEVSKVDDSDGTRNTTTVKSVAKGSTVSKDLDLVTNTYQDFGRVRLTLNAANEQDGTARFTISAAGGSGTASFDRLYTKEGLRIMLPVNTTTANSSVVSPAIGFGNFSTGAAGTGSQASYVLQFLEEDEDGTIASGLNFNATLGLNSDNKVQVSSVSVTDFETEDGSEKEVGYVNSSLASRTMYDTNPDQANLEVTYHGEEAFADVYVSEAGAVISSDDSDDETAVPSTGVKELGSIVVKDTEVSQVATKNLIVVGGSCVNKLAAELLGSSSALCGMDFETKTGVGNGSFLIQSFSRTGGKVATLVAGYSAQDTVNAAKYFTTQSVDTTVGKKYKGTSATSASLVTVSGNSGNTTQ